MDNFFSGTNVRLADGREVDAGEHVRGKMIILYFSATWCHECKSYVSTMKNLYQYIKDNNLPFEMLLVSKDYFRNKLYENYKKNQCEWGIIPLRDPIIDELIERYKIEYLPSFVVVDEHGECIQPKSAFKVNRENNTKMSKIFEKWTNRQEIIYQSDLLIDQF